MSIEEPFLVGQDFYNAYLFEVMVDSYGYDYVFDPFLTNFRFYLEPIIAQSADDPRFLLPPTSYSTTSTTPVKKNSITRVSGW